MSEASLEFLALFLVPYTAPILDVDVEPFIGNVPDEPDSTARIINLNDDEEDEAEEIRGAEGDEYAAQG